MPIPAKARLAEMPEKEHWSGNFSVTEYLCIHQPNALANGLRKCVQDIHVWSVGAIL
jgi:hypothetical protein